MENTTEPREIAVLEGMKLGLDGGSVLSATARRERPPDGVPSRGDVVTIGCSYEGLATKENRKREEDLRLYSPCRLTIDQVHLGLVDMVQGPHFLLHGSLM